MRFPDTYFVCDHAHPVFGATSRLDVWAKPPPNRRDLGLPQDAVVRALGPVGLNGNWEKLFPSGGAGYVLDKLALETLMSVFDKPFCQPHVIIRRPVPHRAPSRGRSRPRARARLSLSAPSIDSCEASGRT